ncbi:hypothetical protein [Paenibacillus sp. MBLB4367]|uniref:hypothetical protein n=1 Tax=Paenibacillus sp. MBLB4367 TaxID=3384767 RepID=UPI003907F29D
MNMFLLSIMILTVTSSSIIPLLKGDDVTSMQVVRNMPGEYEQMYKNTDGSGKDRITKVVGWINSSKIVGGMAEFGKYSMLIKIQMNDGRLITVSQAYKWVHGTMPDGSGISHATPIKGDIVIRTGLKTIRASSPELYEWIQEDCKQELH